MFTVGRKQLGTVLAPRLEQRLQDLAREGEHLVEIDHGMLDGETPYIFRVEETQIPDRPFTDIVAVALPGLGGRNLAAAPLGSFPSGLVRAERVERAQDDVSDLGVLQVARLGHDDDVNTLDLQQLTDGKDFLARGKIEPYLWPPAHDRAGEDDISLGQGFLGRGI